MIIVMKSGYRRSRRGRRVPPDRRAGLSAAHHPSGSSRPWWPRSARSGARPDLRLLEALETVESVMPVQQPFKLASQETRPRAERGPRQRRGRSGGSRVIVMAGPCSVESEAQVLEVADAVKAAGASSPAGRRLQAAHLALRLPGAERAGAQVPARRRASAPGLPVVTEVLETESVELVAEYADILQIGARNIQNFTLLRRVGEMGKPVLLKRGMATSIAGVPALRRVHPVRGQPARDPVRARYSHLRDLHAVHPGPQRGARPEEALAPAGGRGPVPRDRPLGPRRADGQGGGGVRRRRR